MGAPAVLMHPHTLGSGSSRWKVRAFMDDTCDQQRSCADNTSLARRTLIEREADNGFLDISYKRPGSRSRTKRCRYTVPLASGRLRVCPERLDSLSWPCKPPRHKADHREMDEGDGGAGEVFEVFGEPAAASEPGQRSLDDPAFGQDPERILVVAPDDLETPWPELGDRLSGLVAGIGAVADDTGQPLAFSGNEFQYELCAVAVLDVGGMDSLSEDQALRVDNDVALLALDLLRRVIARRIDAGPPFSALLTLCESMMPRLGWRCRPARVRASATSMS